MQNPPSLADGRKHENGRVTGIGTAPTLTERQLEAAAGAVSFTRGEGYVQYVHGLRVVGTTAKASIQAKNVYLVDLDWSGTLVQGSCTCPHAADGNFCKHQVAVGLCVVDRSLGQGTEAGPAPPSWSRYLEGLEADELRDLVRELVERDPGAERLLEVRSAVRGTDPATAARSLVGDVNDALRARGFIDYRRSFDVARAAQEMLAELEGHLEAGAPDVVRPALLRAVTRLRKLTEQADDSSGVIGDACQRAADLYARSCRAGTPDRLKLARWLVKFRAESPGWPQVSLADFEAAFDEKALAAYRKAVAKLDEEHGGSTWDRFEIDQMKLELADHDGDVDAAVAMLTTGDRPQYGGAIDRLRAAGRDEEAVAWMDRAVEEGRVSGRGRGNEFWLDPGDVAETYLSLGRIDDALLVLRGVFARQASAATYSHLVSVAERVGRAPAERAWAIEHARRQAAQQYGNGGVLVEIALRVGDLDAAWEAAHEFDAGHMWQPLAEASRHARPLEAADLYRAQIEKDLRHADTKLYPGIASGLATIRDLYGAADAEQAFSEYLAGIRETYARRPSLMAALDRKGL